MSSPTSNSPGRSSPVIAQRGNPSGSLRQGDICAIPHFPKWDVEESSVLFKGDTQTSIQMDAWNRVHRIETGEHLVVVCSHDCDVDNPRQRSAIIVAPLIKVPASAGDPRYEEIMGSGDMTGELSWINLFPLRIDLEEEDNTDVVADFSALTSMGRAEPAIRQLADSKILEMDDELRSNFKKKLGSFFGRP